jgi:hypothetical protein
MTRIVLLARFGCIAEFHTPRVPTPRVARHGACITLHSLHA